MNNLAQCLIINTNGKLIAWYDNQWRIRAWLHGEFHPGLQFQAGFWNKSSENQIVDYMERDSAWGAIQPMLKILPWYSQTGLGFSARPNGPENLKKSHVTETEFQPGLKKERERAHVFSHLSKLSHRNLCPGWNWACNHNNISAGWAERNFSPGWNSSCNQAVREMQ